jgi:hypothetical protein
LLEEFIEKIKGQFMGETDKDRSKSPFSEAERQLNEVEIAKIDQSKLDFERELNRTINSNYLI